MSKDLTPIVSVVVPVYNAEKYLPETLSDLLNQTLTNAEFIFVDDGSTDSSLSILQSAAEKDKRVRILQQNHKFAGCARNLGLEVAKGKYFIALDADDRFELNLLELTVNRAEETNAEIIVFDADRLLMPENNIYYDPAFCITKHLPEDVFKPDEETEAIFRVMVTWTKLYRLQWIKEKGIKYQGTYESNDILFTFLSLACASKVAKLTKTLIHYRVGETSNIQSTLDLHPCDGILAFRELKNNLIKYGLFEDFRNLYSTSLVRILLGRRITKFNSISAAEEFYLNLKSSLIDILDVDNISNINFVSNKPEDFKKNLLEFYESQNLYEWLILVLKRYCNAKDKFYFKFFEIKKQLKRIASLEESFSYRIGCFLTFPLRFLMKFINTKK